MDAQSTLNTSPQNMASSLPSPDTEPVVADTAEQSAASPAQPEPASVNPASKPIATDPVSSSADVAAQKAEEEELSSAENVAEVSSTVPMQVPKTVPIDVTQTDDVESTDPAPAGTATVEDATTQEGAIPPTATAEVHDGTAGEVEEGETPAKKTKLAEETETSPPKKVTCEE